MLQPRKHATSWRGSAGWWKKWKRCQAAPDLLWSRSPKKDLDMVDSLRKPLVERNQRKRLIVINRPGCRSLQVTPICFES
jgi:hypothetical protein